MRGYDNWARIFIAALLLCFLFLNTGSAKQDHQKPKASLAPLNINTSISQNDQSLLARLDIAKRLREGLVDSGLFAVYSRDSAELKGSVQREKELAESGLAQDAENTAYQYALTSYFFVPKVTRFSAYSTYSEIPHIKGIYDREDVGRITLHLAAIGSDGAILFEETGKARFSTKYEYESAVKPKGGRPEFFGLEKMTDTAIHKVLSALDSRVNPITIYDRYGDVVLINRGKNSGFEIGEKMIVFSQPKDWTNPNTGITSRMPGRQVGVVEISRIDEKSSEAKVITDNGIEPNFVLRIK